MTLVLASVLVPSSESWRIAGASVSGGRSLAGTEQVVVGSGGYWMASLTIPVHRDEQVLAARALLAGLDGRAGTLLAGPHDGRRANWPVDRYGRRITPRRVRRPQLDGTSCADAPDLVPSLILATLAAPAALRATNAEITVHRGSSLRAGQYFGIGDRLHLITAVTAIDGDANSVTFRPPLRAAALANAQVDIVAPRTSMRLASDDTGLALDLLRFGTLQLDLVEVP